MSRSDLISVLVCTRDRGDAVVHTLASILASNYPSFELIIVDQSESDATADAIARLPRDPRLRYTRSAVKGLSRARNEGLALARGAIVAMTDDDCGVPETWLTETGHVFESDPRVGAVFFDVLPAKHDPAQGSVPYHVFASDQRIASIAEWRQTRKQPLGFGASMAVRRDAALAVGGFDPQLGAGAPFRSAEDLDLPLRLLLRKYSVVCSKRSFVVHYGFRTWPEADELYHGYAIGPMATYAKLVKAGEWQFALFFGVEIWRDVILPSAKMLLRGRKPTLWARLTGMINGFAAGLALPINREERLFRDHAILPPLAEQATVHSFKVRAPEPVPSHVERV